MKEEKKPTTILDSISMWDFLQKHKEILLLFPRPVVRVDEHLILYSNVELERSWGKRMEPSSAIQKGGLHAKKVLCKGQPMENSVSGGWM